MGWTKRQFVEAAFEEIGYANYVFDLQPEQLESAMRRMDSMLAQWNGRGIRLGYPVPSSPENSDLDEETGVPDSANEAIYTNLAIRIAPAVGKVVTMETRKIARESYNELIARYTLPVEMQFPETLPVGQGNKPWRYEEPYFPEPDEGLLAGEDGPIEFN